MSQVTIGVDIGLKGAIAVLDTVDPTVGINTVTGEVARGVRVWDMPTKKIKKLCTKGKRRGKILNVTVYDIDRIRDILASIVDHQYSGTTAVCFVEAAIIKPYGYNIKTSIGLARCQAIFEGLLSALKVPCYMVLPQEWQNGMGLTGKQKSGNANVLLAQEKHPGIQFKTARGRVLDGRADALLIAEFGYDLWVEPQVPAAEDTDDEDEG